MKVGDSRCCRPVVVGLCVIMALCVYGTVQAAADETDSPQPDSIVAEQETGQVSEAMFFPAPGAVVSGFKSTSVGETTSSPAAPVQEDFEESAQLQPRLLGDIRPSLDYAWGDVEESALPEDFAKNTDDESISRVIGAPMLLQWQPTNLWYHPLYFEDPALERSGHTYSPLVQSLVSTGRFVGQAATMPYHAALRPMHSREYPLGWYRPGECAPYLTHRPAWNDEAAVHQALMVVGLVFLIP